MSSTLRLSIIMVLVLATAAFGLIAYSNMNPKPVVQVTENTPAPPPSTVGYFVAHVRYRELHWRAKKISKYARVASDSVPTGAILDTRDARKPSSRSLVRRFLDAGSPVTSQRPIEPARSGFSRQTSWHRIAVRSASKLTRSLACRAYLAG